MILRIRDIPVLAHDVVVDNGNLMFAPLNTGGADT
jgi:hypothetical protein